MKIGVALLDLSSLKVLGPNYDNGNPKAQAEAVLAGWKRSGLVPVGGRDVQLVFQTFDPLDASSQTSACTGLVEDDAVFAVAGMGFFRNGSDCVAGRFHVPMVEADSENADALVADAPFLVTPGISEDRQLRNWAYWAHTSGRLRGHRIGLYHLDDAVTQHLMDSVLKPELARQGDVVAAEGTTSTPLGGPADLLAVQRFRGAGVDVAMMMTGEATVGFMQQADAQGYHPAYLLSDLNSETTQAVGSGFPPAQGANAIGFTDQHYGEPAAGFAPSPYQTKCLGDYRRLAGSDVSASRDTEYNSVLGVCDILNVVLKGLQGAGPNLTPISFMNGIASSVRSMPLGRYADATITPSKPDGADYWREERWHTDCKCFKAFGLFQPLWLP
ncbi:MAG: ABC transporter substrate-binding protein [Acidimicrobiales bacterium]